MRRIELTEGEHKRLVDCVDELLAAVGAAREMWTLRTHREPLPLPPSVLVLAAIKDKLAAAPREGA